MNDIFISYKVHNRATAIEYYRVLKAQGYGVWFDQFVPKGENWKSTIFEQISSSRLILCLLSEACLLDDWVKYQLDIASFLHKQVIFITLDTTAWNEHPEYQVEKRTYSTLEEMLTSDSYFKKTEEGEAIEKTPFVEPINEERINLNKLLNPILNFGILTISTILLLLFDLHFFRLTLDRFYGFILIGIMILVCISYIKKWYIYVIQCLGAISLLVVTIYVFPPYYISGISVNGLVFLFFLTFSMYLRYSKAKVWLALPMALCLSCLFVALNAALLIFLNVLFDIELYYISILLLCCFLGYLGWSLRKDFKSLKK